MVDLQRLPSTLVLLADTYTLCMRFAAGETDAEECILEQRTIAAGQNEITEEPHASPPERSPRG
jgi:hypothetical protein